jgi:hypothetical protein
MIPPLNSSGVLPPFIPTLGVTIPAAMAPYKTTPSEIVTRFATSPERNTILRGLMDYRQLLNDSGVTDGFQWIDGSYVENCEIIRGLSPHDIDVVTFAERPLNCHNDALWDEFVENKRVTLFDRPGIKSRFLCDAYYQDMALPNKVLVERARYWFGLFSHQRVTYLWKGLLEIPLQSDDMVALELLSRGGINVP